MADKKQTIIKKQGPGRVVRMPFEHGRKKIIITPRR